MKKSLICLTLVATMLVSAFTMTACSYNWEQSAPAAITLNLDAIKGKTLTAKKVDDVDADYVNAAIHNLLLTLATDKSERATGDTIKVTDIVNVDVTVNQSLLFYETAALYTVSDLKINLNDAVAAQSDLVNAGADYISKMIHKDLTTRLATDEVKVGDKITFATKAVVKGTEKKDSDGNVTGVQNVTVLTPYTNVEDETATDSATITVDVTYTVVTALMDASEVVIADSDIFSLFFTREEEGVVDYTNAVKYDFSTSALTGAVSFDPAKTNAKVSAAFAAALVGATESTAGTVLSSGTEIAGDEFVKITVNASFDTGEEASTSTAVADISAKVLSMNLLDTDDKLGKLIADNLASKIADPETECKVGGEFSFTYDLYVDNNNKVYKADNTFYTALDNEGSEEPVVTLYNVKITYTVSSAYSFDYQTVTVTEDDKDVIYGFYVTDVKEVPTDITLEQLCDSDFANDSKDDYNVTRYFYVATNEETDDNGEKTGVTEYLNNYYGETLFKVTEAEGVKTFFVTDENGEETDVMFKLDTSKKVETEADAALYAVEAYLVKYEEETKKQEGIKAIWNALSEAAVIDYPQNLLDEYYNEYIQNAKYTFYETHNGVVSETTGSKDANGNAIVNTYKTFNAYLASVLSVASEDKIRDAVDTLAKAELKDRLLLFKVSELTGITVTDEEYKNALENVNVKWQYNNYMYSYYYSYYYQMLGDSVKNINFGYSWYDTVDDYITALYGDKDGIKAGILFDKVMEAIYSDEGDAYNVTIAYTNAD